MTTFRRPLAVVMVLATMVAACGGDDDDSADTPTPTEPATAPAATDAPDGTDAPAPTEAPDAPGTTAGDAGPGTTAAAPDNGGEPAALPEELDADACASTQGVTDDTITVGVLTDLSGPVSAGGGIDIGESFKAHFAAVNAAGGIGGYQIEVLIEDMKYDPVATAQAYETVREDVAMMPIILSSSGIEAVSQDMADDCLLTLEGGPNGQLSQKHVTVFTPTTSVGHDVINAISWALEENPDATFALALQADATGRQTQTAADFAAAEAGANFVGKVEFSPADADLTAQIQSLISMDPTYVIFGGGVPNQLAALASGLDSAGAAAEFLVPTSGWSPNVLSTPAAPAIEKKVIVFSSYGPWNGDEPGLVQMREELEAYPDRDFAPGAPPLLGYETSLVAEEVLRIFIENGDMTLGGMYRAAQQVENFDPQGVAPVLTYGREGEPRIPSTSSRAYRTDADTPGGLVPLSDGYLDAELNQQYVEPASN